MEILIISGLSGGGKSKAASFLEDVGFYIVDNMPAGMILKFAEFCAAGNGRYNRVALVYDVRTADTFDEFLGVLLPCGSGNTTASCCFWRRMSAPLSSGTRRPGAATPSRTSRTHLRRR